MNKAAGDLLNRVHCQSGGEGGRGKTVGPAPHLVYLEEAVQSELIVRVQHSQWRRL
jgi:hypothetical protein